MSLKIANSFQEAVELGHIIANEKKEIYSQRTLNNMMERVCFHMPGADEAIKQDLLYAAVYDWNAYGANVDEEFAYKFYEKSHAEKAEYLVGWGRGVYVDYLNGGFSRETINKLENKWTLYKRLESYYKREIIHIVSEADIQSFLIFAARYSKYVVKPLNCSCGIGIHLDSVDNYDSPEDAFYAILNAGIAINQKHPVRSTEIILEEVIDQEETMARLHPQSVNALRITTVRRADGKMVISCNSPVGRAMIGRCVGDTCVVKLPSGEKEYEILEVKFKE